MCEAKGRRYLHTHVTCVCANDPLLQRCESVGLVSRYFGRSCRTFFFEKLVVLSVVVMNAIVVAERCLHLSRSPLLSRLGLQRFSTWKHLQTTTTTAIRHSLEESDARAGERGQDMTADRQTEDTMLRILLLPTEFMEKEEMRIFHCPCLWDSMLA